MKTIIEPDTNSWLQLCTRPVIDSVDLNSKVNEIIDKVKSKKDQALIEFTEKFDSVKIERIEVSTEEINTATVSNELKKAIDIAIGNVEKFHSSQLEKTINIETTKGVNCWRESRAIQSVGFYIPGGTAPLFSSIIMLGVPAKIAGCENTCLCSPPNKEGKLDPAILYTAKKVGIKKVFKVGGAQAIAAMAFGTESVPKCYKIFGPGNQYVTATKQIVSTTGTAIDLPAGPSEVAIYADKTANAKFVAADLLSQAEHGIDSQVILVASSQEIAESIEQEIEEQIENLSRKEIAKKALENSLIVVLSDSSKAFDFLNSYATEHLIIASDQAKNLAQKVINAGSVFIGNYTPESAGDYCSGTNHVLPTNKAALAYSGVSLDSFIKKITFQEISKEGLDILGPSIEVMAEAEGLDAHANASRIRRQNS